MTERDEAFQALRSVLPEERRRAIGVVAKAGNAQSIPWIIRMMGDIDWRVRKEATSAALRLAPDPALLAELVKVLGPGDNVGLRNAAMEALGGFGRHAITALEAEIPQLDPDGKKLAIEAMARTGDSSAATVLLRLFDDEDVNVRAAAIEAVAQLGPYAGDQVSTALERALAEGSGYERLVVLEAINRLRIRLEYHTVESFISDPVLRKAAIIAAGRSADLRAATALGPALEDAPPALYPALLGANAELALTSPQGLSAVRRALRLTERGTQRLFQAAIDNNEEVETRRVALLVCGALGTTEAALAVIPSLAEDSVAKEAEAALAMIGGPAISALAKYAGKAQSQLRALCVEFLGRLAEPSNTMVALDAIRAAMRDENPEVIRASLGALSKIGDEESLADAARWFKGRFPAHIRLAARAALAARAKAYPERAKEIAIGIRPDGPLAAAAALIISVLDRPVFKDAVEDIQFLASAVSNPDPFVRRTALEALTNLRSGAAADAIAFALNDEVQEVQLAALRALGRVRNQHGECLGTDHLIGMIHGTQDETVLAVAIESLGTTLDPRALTLLRTYCTSSNAAIAVAAVEALVGFDSSARSEVAQRALGHRDSEVVKAALRLLAECSDTELVSKIAVCLTHDAWDVRRLGADALGKLGGEGARHALEARMGEEDEPLVIEAIRRSLAYIESGHKYRSEFPPREGSDGS